MYILGIETSCDETSCAVLKNFKVLSNVTISSLKEHKKYGGVVPEIATRAHLKNIDRVLLAAFDQAGIPFKKIDLVAVTYRPGLIGALVVGLNFAKTLALVFDKPFIGVNHLDAHIFAPFLDNAQKLEFPFLGLVVSGGHTEIYLVEDFTRIKLLGQTRDDACGEVYDKVSKTLGLGYPGGPVIDSLFDIRRKNDFKFKCGKIGLDLSFSGIKTGFIYKKEELGKTGVLDKKKRIGLISSFQSAVVEAIVCTVIEAARKYKIKKIACGGGVIANRYLRQRLQEQRELQLLIAPFEYAADNAAIVAGLGFYLYNNKGLKSPIDLQAEVN